MAEAGRRVPADGGALELAVRDVERPVDQDGEAQAGAGAELERADAALDAVAERGEAHAGELRQHAGVLADLAARHRAAVEGDHGQSPFARSRPSRNFLARGTSASSRCSMMIGMFGCFSATRWR